MKIRGATLLETLVATAVFLIVFGLSLGALVRINRMGDADWATMEKDFNRRRETPGNLPDTVVVYPWGKMTWTVSDSNEADDLSDIKVTAVMKGGQTVIYRFLKDGR